MTVSRRVNTECERLLLTFIPVAAVALYLFPSAIHCCQERRKEEEDELLVEVL